MKLICFAALLGLASSTAVKMCEVGDWEAWSECTSSRRCMSDTERSSRLQTWAKPASDAWDIGRGKMQYLMKKKLDRWDERAACLAEGSCPAFADRPSSGFTACQGGSAADLPCSNIDQMYFMNFIDMGYVKANVPTDTVTEGNDIWGWTDPQNGDEYAIMGLTGGTTFVRITDPQNPVPAGVVYTQTTASTWRDIKVIGNYAYIVSEARNHGLQVFDLTRLRGSQTATTFLPDAHYNGFGNAHNIVSNEDTNFVYVVGATQNGYPLTCSGGLFAIDVSNPLNPTYAGCFGGDGYVHDAQCVVYHGPDTAYQGREVCFCYNEDTFTIVDVENKPNNMVMISKTGYSNAQYTHQGWLTEDHRIALLDDELDENGQPSQQQFTKTYIWNIEDLNGPQLINIYQASDRSIDHNQYVVGDLTFQSNYEAGLRILSIDSASYQLSQVAYFDVFPSRTSAQFYGSWSVYPYFASGNVVVSSIDYGLFVLRPNYAAIQAQIASKQTYAERTRTRQMIYRTAGSQCPALQQSQTCHVDTNC